MIHTFNGQAWYFPEANELESTQAPDSSRLAFADRPDAPSPNGGAVKPPNPSNPRKKRAKPSLALKRNNVGENILQDPKPGIDAH